MLHKYFRNLNSLPPDACTPEPFLLHNLIPSSVRWFWETLPVLHFQASPPADPIPVRLLHKQFHALPHFRLRSLQPESRVPKNPNLESSAFVLPDSATEAPRQSAPLCIPFPSRNLSADFPVSSDPINLKSGYSRLHDESPGFHTQFRCLIQPPIRPVLLNCSFLFHRGRCFCLLCFPTATERYRRLPVLLPPEKTVVLVFQYIQFPESQTNDRSEILRSESPHTH